jgi:RNA polymerase sigma factor (sigma-70 family)
MAGGRTPLEELSLQKDKEQLAAALERLREKYRVVVQLRYVEGLPFPEIGERLGIAKNATKLRHREAVRRLLWDLSSRA